MKFYLMRHGEAEIYALSDKARQLTDHGAQQVQERINTLKASLSNIDCIIHSPYVRTTQTAKIAADILNITNVSSSALWVPNADPLCALESIEAFVENTPLFITHMPLVALVEAHCVGEKNYPMSFECCEVSVLEAEWPAAGLGTFKRL
jgi:phosphohistidine phosphatase